MADPTPPARPSAPRPRDGGAPHAGAHPTEDTAASAGDAPHTDPAGARDKGERGSLELADRVLVKIARRAALEVDGVAPAGAATGRLGRALGGGYPDADVEHAGTRAAVTLEIATLWPHPAAVVAAAVRESVTGRLRDLAAVEADTVTVHVATVVAPPTSDQTTRDRRVR